MSFSTLPPELRLSIVEHLDSMPTLNFALTSKEHFKLSEDRLREHAMFAKYSTIQTSYDGTLVWDLTKEILLDPRKGCYVRELNLHKDRPETHQNISEEDKVLFKEAAEKILPLYPDDHGFFAADVDDPAELGRELEFSITRGTEDAVLVILFHHLPQLRTLGMADAQTGDVVLPFMRRVAAGYQNPTLASQMPFQHLETVAITRGYKESACTLDWAVYFMCVPSLRTFAAQMMSSEGVRNLRIQAEAGSEAHLRNTVGVPVSNVEELLFYDCQFDTQSFNTILPMVKNLKRFCCQAAGQQAADQDYEPRKVIQALAHHSSHSLEELELAEWQMGLEGSQQDLRFVSMRGFIKLKALHCETRWLLPEPNDDLGDDEALPQGFHTAEEVQEEIRDPRNNLPESLEYLCLDGVYDFEEWTQLVDIFRTANASTPKLTLNNTRLSSNGESDYGGAVEPEDRFDSELLKYMVNHL